MTTRRTPALPLPTAALLLALLLGASAASTHVKAQPTGGESVVVGGGLTTLSFDPAEILRPGTVFFIKSKGSQKVLDVSGGSTATGTRVQQLSLAGTAGQKFFFEETGDGFFFVRTSTGGHFLTLNTRSNPASAFLTQEPPAAAPPAADAQKWQIRLTDERTAFLIVNKATGDLVLQPSSAGDGASVRTVARQQGNDLQKWVVKPTTTETNPDTAASENGLVSDCFTSFTAFKLVSYRENISRAFPEWRSVGETVSPNGFNVPPAHAYRVLEGRVSRRDLHVNYEDMPAAHFTHDFNFDVFPDPPFRHLLGRHLEKRFLPGPPRFVDVPVVQGSIEVEWETGLAQGHDAARNPAAPASRRGDSFGFYSAGHRRRDVIWNWPTIDDWVHVEGVWVYDRGHTPVLTEIHPPHFIAVRRSLPDKFESQPGKFFIATRADFFANGDGNVIWNNKRLHPFTQPVRMSEHVYTVVIKHDLPRPTPTAKLAFAFVRQRGDTYPAQPLVTVLENGSPDEPTPHVVVTVRWKADGAPETAVLGRTLFVFWDDPATHGVPPGFPLKRVVVTLEKVIIQNRKDDGVAEYRLFADVGGRWLFLNEFTGATDVITGGLGDAWDNSNPFFPKPPGAEFEFNFNQTFEFFVPEGKSGRVAVSGWEGDFMENQYGRVANPFFSCEEAKRFLRANFNATDYATGGKLDDSAGEATAFFGGNTADGSAFSVESRGPVTDNFGDRNDPNKAFRVNFRARVPRDPFAP